MVNTTWLEISLEVEGEMAEPVAEVFSRYAPGGVVIESILKSTGSPQLEAEAVNPVRVTCYLKNDKAVESIRLKLEENLWFLGRIRSLPEPVYRLVHEEDWAKAWKDHFHPVEIGRKLLISPAWNQSNPEGRTQIIMNPGMAFGTGAHPSTRLCLELIEDLLEFQNIKGNKLTGRNSAKVFDVIDIGCGSGILAIAALKLGAGQAFCVDIDPIAVKISQENGRLNHVADRMQVREGSLDEIKRWTPQMVNNRLILANILAPVLINMLNEGLADLLREGNFLVMSGIIADQRDGLINTAEKNGFSLRAERIAGDWVALCAQKGV
jgi:ribosomal protein L11 methyltransferase